MKKNKKSVIPALDQIPRDRTNQLLTLLLVVMLLVDMLLSNLYLLMLV